MKKYEVIKGCVIKGNGHQVGDIVELEDYEVNQLIAIGRILEVKQEPKKAQNRSVGLSGDKPTKRKAKEETPVEPVEPVEPVKPVKPVEPVEPVEKKEAE